MMRIIVLTMVCCFALASCGKRGEHANQEQTQVVTVEKKPNTVMLPYSGKISPIRVVAVTTPEEGTVAKMNFVYGQKVEKGQVLLTIHSPKLESDFHEAVTSFLKAKDHYLNSQASIEGSQELYDEKIIAKKEFINEKSQHENNELAYVDAKFKLEKILDYVPGFDRSIEELNLGDVSRIRAIFSKTLDDIVIKASASGIVLFPVHVSTEEGGGSSNELEVGTAVKKGQALLSIGDLTGISVDFEINESDVSRVKPGLTASVASTSGPNMTLKGVIKDVAVQAKSARGNSDSSSFPAKVIVENIPAETAKELRVGMSAKITVEIVGKPEIMIPIQAVHAEKGKRFVTLALGNEKNEQREVQTGRTTQNDVIILHGLKPGDKVLVND
ncbi:MAG: efflux RND transporter periplasmic adaptor subunit [Pseudomonadota bacterium]|nr:efflux RND transporter periplasmic adaptor subunit [Pseudomonadota bacterium]